MVNQSLVDHVCLVHVSPGSLHAEDKCPAGFRRLTTILTRKINMTNTKHMEQAINALNLIMEIELAGVVRYTHYSLMIFGYNRIPGIM